MNYINIWTPAGSQRSGKIWKTECHGLSIPKLIIFICVKISYYQFHEVRRKQVLKKLNKLKLQAKKIPYRCFFRSDRWSIIMKAENFLQCEQNFLMHSKTLRRQWTASDMRFFGRVLENLVKLSEHQYSKSFLEASYVTSSEVEFRKICLFSMHCSNIFK